MPRVQFGQLVTEQRDNTSSVTRQSSSDTIISIDLDLVDWKMQMWKNHRYVFYITYRWKN